MTPHFLLPLSIFYCPPLKAHLLLCYLSISGALWRSPPILSLCAQVLVCTGIALVFLSCVSSSSSPLSYPPIPLSFVLREPSESSDSGSQGGGGGGGRRWTVVSAEQWGWLASCSVRCCAVSGTLSGQLASRPPPPDWSPLCETHNSTYSKPLFTCGICNIAGFICSVSSVYG